MVETILNLIKEVLAVLSTPTFYVHLLLAIILFILLNWIGSKSYSVGYIKFSLLDDADEALSFNYALKVFGPIIYLILISALFQYYGYNNYITNIINVIYYYILIRIVVIFIYERQTIVNWGRIFIYYISVIIFSQIFYYQFIDSVNTLLPDFSELKNEIWLLVILFLYKIGNGVTENTYIPYYETSKAYLPNLSRRKERYILNKYSYFQQKYGNEIKAIIDKKEIDNIHKSSFQIMIISIIIYENFNRPRFVRFLERIYVKINNREVTQGIMQIASDKPVSDLESVKVQTNSLVEHMFSLLPDNSYRMYARIIKKQCPDKKYIRQILFISKCIIEKMNLKTDCNKLYDDIIYEFELYDLY